MYGIEGEKIMPKLYFKYGAMGCSKSAQALMCKYNYEQKGFKVLLIKPSIDNRDDENGTRYIKSRIGLKSKCEVFDTNTNLEDFINHRIITEEFNVVIVDECNFCTADQIDQLKEISNQVPVLCYGLKTNFKGFLFEGSKRLFEIADSLMEIKSVCKCGKKATMNARMVGGRVVIQGDDILIGGDETYESMCYTCWKAAQKSN